DEARPPLAAFDLRAAIPAGFWRVLGPAGFGKDRPDDGDRLVDRDAHRRRCFVVCPLHPGRAGVLAAGPARQGRGGHAAWRGGCLMATPARLAEFTSSSRLSAYVALTKPDVSFLVVMTTAAGYYMASRGALNWLQLLHAVFATALIAAGTAALNHYVERESDGYMRRTAARPLPSGALEPGRALAFGVALATAGAVDLYVVGVCPPALLGPLTSRASLLGSPPLKNPPVGAPFVGAFPGAIPPMIGWAAATGTLDRGAWLLFAILFLWQFPHFHAIAW